MGLTQFAPFWRDDARIVLHASNESVGREPSRTLFAVINRPLFPVDAGELPAAVGVHEFEIGAAFAPEPGVNVHTFALSHQGASAGIVVEHGGRKLCYVTDHEHGDAAADARVIRAATGADLLIYDATFSDAEMPEHRGWGHSSWEEGLRVKEKAGASLLALAHHDPDRIDAHLDRRAEAAAKKSANVFFAKQGMTVDL